MTQGNAPTVQFTDTERRILLLLSDDLPHTLGELFTCLDDELATMNAVHVHLRNLRKKLRLLGEDVLCVAVRRRVAYQHVGLPRRPYGTGRGNIPS